MPGDAGAKAAEVPGETEPFLMHFLVADGTQPASLPATARGKVNSFSVPHFPPDQRHVFRSSLHAMPMQA